MAFVTKLYGAGGAVRCGVQADEQTAMQAVVHFMAAREGNKIVCVPTGLDLPIRTWERKQGTWVSVLNF